MNRFYLCVIIFFWNKYIHRKWVRKAILWHLVTFFTQTTYCFRPPSTFLTLFSLWWICSQFCFLHHPGLPMLSWFRSFISHGFAPFTCMVMGLNDVFVQTPGIAACLPLLSHAPLRAHVASSASQPHFGCSLGDFGGERWLDPHRAEGLGWGPCGSPPSPISGQCLPLAAWPWNPGGRVTSVYVTYRKLDIIKTWATVTRQGEGFCVIEVKKKVISEILVSGKSDPFHSFCSFIDSGTIEGKQITLYLADSSHLLISRSLSYVSGNKSGIISMGSHSLQPLRRELLNVAEEATAFLQMLAIGGRLTLLN